MEKTDNKLRKTSRFLLAGGSAGKAAQTVFAGTLFVGALTGLFFGLPFLITTTYEAPAAPEDQSVSTGVESAVAKAFVVTHLETPEPLRAIYMSQCVVGTKNFRDELVQLIDDTELNAVVIDIKDYSGKIAFPTNNPILAPAVSEQCGARDMKEFIGVLHEKGIYVIGRITVFQDPFYTKEHPELSVKKASDTSAVWKDYKGLSFIEVGAEEFWKYIVEIGKESYAIGFDELNFDYIRFPSDGNMRDIYYPFSEAVIVSDPSTGKARVLRDFFTYLARELAPTGAVLSADLFGMTMTNSDDLNIGQILEYTEPYFDYVAPMVYPSHYPPTFNGWSDPNKHPYEVVKFSLDSGVARLVAASSTAAKLRPWLQDFDYGGNYDIPEVKAQIQATYDAGLTSWMLWSPSNRYTAGALETE